MRLKTLEIKGFKSFADKTVINFSEDVIGVVGSNGCGKSNVVDAIKWVLGEQKTSALRSDTMTNVIFNGTKTRNAAGLAEVALIFENDKNILPKEYTDVAIKRVLYKDGTGEYYLNNVKCRLKDIQTLLADTGVSSDSYAIIALSMVDDLLADKDNARLGLFEQAAGVSKYKIRKKETLNKLKTVDEDLARVEDLLAEIEKNLLSLEKQAARTQKYLDLKNNYKNNSIAFGQQQAAKYNLDYQQINGLFIQEKKQIEDNEILAQRLEMDLETAKSTNSQEEQLLNEAQKQLSQLIGRIKAKENELKITAQKQEFAAESVQKLTAQLREAQQKIEKLQQTILNQQANLNRENSRENELSIGLKNAQNELNESRELHSQRKTGLDAQIKANASLQNQLFEIEKQAVSLEAKTEQAQQSIQQTSDLIAQKQLENTHIAAELGEKQAQILSSTAEIQLLQSKENSRKETLESTYAGLEICKENLAECNRVFDAKENEQKLLKGLVESLEGFSESVKFLSKQSQWAAKAVLFSDLIFCQADYRVAVENYLDAYLSYYVVADIAEAVAAIRLLDEHKKGKANFFILSQVVDIPYNLAAQGEEVAAIKVVSTAEKYQPLLNNLLANVVLIPAKTTIDEPNPAKIYLSQDGKFSQRAYHLRGGSVGAFEGKKIGRKKNLELLETELITIQSDKNNLKAQKEQLLAKAQTLKTNSYEKEIHKLEQKNREWQQAAAVIQSKIENFEAQINDYQLSIQAQTAKKTNNEALLSALNQNLYQKKNELASQKANFEQQETDYKQVAELLAQKSATFNQNNIELLKQQNRAATLRQELEFAQQQIAETQTMVENSQLSLQNLRQEIANLDTQQAREERELQESQKARHQAQDNLEELDKKYFQLRAQLHEIEEQIRANSKKYQLSLQIANQLELRQSELKMQLNAISERLKVEFEYDMETETAAEQSQDNSTTEEELGERLNKLRQKVQNFGAVNYMAIEAYQETKTRYDFINGQKNDLVTAKQTLLNTLQEVESVAIKLFMEAFSQVRVHFIGVFRSLFDEDDTCDLILTDVQNPLESKIEIIARPKGKKPLSINQLSGGEKTLTATALLFALYLLKPAPFCVFDEVDAPLDDANIAKFNHIIRDFASRSQFIIVTHNKKTMETVNILYGVTMVQGVSRVVPVDFRHF